MFIPYMFSDFHFGFQPNAWWPWAM